MKKITLIMIAMVVSLTSVGFANSARPNVVVNDKLLSTQAINKNDRVIVPLRAIFEALDATVDYNHNAKTITGKKGDKEVFLKVNDKNAKVNGKAVVLDVPASIVDSKTYVPVRFVSESLEVKVEWDHNTVWINSVVNTEILPAEKNKDYITKTLGFKVTAQDADGVIYEGTKKLPSGDTVTEILINKKNPGDILIFGDCKNGEIFMTKFNKKRNDRFQFLFGVVDVNRDELQALYDELISLGF